MEFDLKALRGSKGEEVARRLQFYEFLDQELPDVPLVYYRLKQIDFDGTYAYSEVVSVQHQRLRPLSVYPTVLSKSNAKLQIRGGGQFKSFHVVNVEGRLLFSRIREPEWQQEVDLSALGPGQYYFVGKNGSQLRSLPFFIVNP